MFGSGARHSATYFRLHAMLVPLARNRLVENRILEGRSIKKHGVHASEPRLKHALV
jgi:hypothetical protein